LSWGLIKLTPRSIGCLAESIESPDQNDWGQPQEGESGLLFPSGSSQADRGSGYASELFLSPLDRYEEYSR
jgi:hypothetical protein